MFNKIKSGFTLAEVLITLVIIGVVAALTIPTAINNYRKQEYVSALKKTYSTLAQATNRIIAEEGTPKSDIGGWGTLSNTISLYKKYLNAKDCSVSDCFARYKTAGPKALTGQPTNAWTSTSGLVLADGIQILPAHFSSSCSYQDADKCFEIFVDINGQKGPNQYGRDVFVFPVYEDGLVMRPSSTTDCNPNSSQTTGWTCSRRVLIENAMNY